MPNPAARRHALPIPRQNDRPGSQAIFVLELAFKNICDDLHIAMRMRRKSSVRRDPNPSLHESSDEIPST